MRPPVSFGGPAAPTSYPVAPGSLLPAPGSPAAAVSAETPTLFFQSVLVKAGSIFPVVISGNYLYVEGIKFETTALHQFNNADNYLTVKPDQASAKARLISPKRAITFAARFGSLQFENTSGVDAVVSCWIGSGDIRADYDGYLINSAQSILIPVAGTGVAYAAGQMVGGGFVFPGACSKYTQRATLKKITVTKGDPSTANANFTLWLFASYTGSGLSNKAAFTLGANGFTDYIGSVALPAFVTGGAGSAMATCDVSGIDMPLYSSATDSNGYTAGSIYGALVANAPYVQAYEAIVLNMTLEWK